MTRLKEQIIDKLHSLEKTSEPTLQSIFDYICFLEARLETPLTKTMESDLEEGYRAMAADLERETEAIAQSEALIENIAE